MPHFIAQIVIMPHKELLDPQGKTVAKNMRHVHIEGIIDVRIGKNIEMTLEAESEAHAKELIDQSCKKLLANLITETYSFQVKEQKS